MARDARKFRPYERELRALGLWREWTSAEVAAIPRLDSGLRARDKARMNSKPRALRETLGISIRKLSADLSYDKGNFSRLETGQRAWTIRFALLWLDYMLLAIARARRDGHPIPDEAIPTLRELAMMGPEDPRTRRSRKGGKGHARRKVFRRA